MNNKENTKVSIRSALPLIIISLILISSSLGVEAKIKEQWSTIYSGIIDPLGKDSSNNLVFLQRLTSESSANEIKVCKVNTEGGTELNKSFGSLSEAYSFKLLENDNFAAISKTADIFYPWVVSYYNSYLTWVANVSLDSYGFSIASVDETGLIYGCFSVLYVENSINFINDSIRIFSELGSVLYTVTLQTRASNLIVTPVYHVTVAENGDIYVGIENKLFKINCISESLEWVRVFENEIKFIDNIQDDVCVVNYDPVSINSDATVSLISKDNYVKSNITITAEYGDNQIKSLEIENEDIAILRWDHTPTTNYIDCFIFDSNLTSISEQNWVYSSYEQKDFSVENIVLADEMQIYFLRYIYNDFGNPYMSVIVFNNYTDDRIGSSDGFTLITVLTVITAFSIGKHRKRK